MEERRNLYFGDGTHFQMILSDVSVEEVFRAIREHIDKTERPSHYVRHWEEDGVRWVDYGSWSTFFVWASPERYREMVMKSQRMEEMHER